MKNKELYNKTVDILVQAYFNDTLKHGSCSACAVGNLVCENWAGGDRVKWELSFYENKPIHWASVIDYGFDRPRTENYYGRAKEQIDSTGYSVQELARIEEAFERANRRRSYGDEAMFKGLMNVIEVLDKIHENTDIEVTETSKKRFQRA